MSSLTNTNPLENAGSLDDFQPRPRTHRSPEQVVTTRTEKTAVRQAAQDRGFTIDNLATVVRAKRSTSSKTSKSHTLRLYLEDINRFQTWCNENNFSQAKGFEILLDKSLNNEEQ